MTHTPYPVQKIIVALDVDSRAKALSLVDELPEAKTFKVGLQLFTAEGPELLEELHNLGKRVFLDLKLHDIPNTVAGAVREAVRHGVSMLTVHASGGREMMASAVEEASRVRDTDPQHPAKFLLLGVTVLTSLKAEHLKEIGMAADPLDQVAKLAGLALEAGLDGAVCSPQEISRVKEECGRDFLVVAPGIRPVWAAVHDQKRIMTPSQAVERGADYVVIGRPIIAAASPGLAFKKIVEELDAVNTPDRKDRSEND